MAHATDATTATCYDGVGHKSEYQLLCMTMTTLANVECRVVSRHVVRLLKSDIRRMCMRR